MSDETSAARRVKIKDFIISHRRDYLESGGVKGHIVNSLKLGGHYLQTHILLKYRGRKSGKIFISPLIYADIGGEVVIVASKGGADHHPAWYLNICESPEVEFQVGTQAFRGTWREPVGAEREKVWAFMVDCFPAYAGYQSSTDRQIPLVMMKPTEEIPVFKPEDATGERETW
jgi:deazaflavin-dependent oxidoreductase (nitroreductase family)